MSFELIKDNEWQTPLYKGYKLICCDCGLVHDTDFRVYKGMVQFKVRRNEKLTKIERERKGQYP